MSNVKGDFPLVLGIFTDARFAERLAISNDGIQCPITI